MSEKELRAKVKALEAKVYALEHPVAPKPVKKDATIVLCTWAGARSGSGVRCGWTGPAFGYQAHLDAEHHGKDYVEPKTGIPVKGD